MQFVTALSAVFFFLSSLLFFFRKTKSPLHTVLRAVWWWASARVFLIVHALSVKQHVFHFELGLNLRKWGNLPPFSSLTCSNTGAWCTHAACDLMHTLTAPSAHVTRLCLSDGLKKQPCKCENCNTPYFVTAFPSSHVRRSMICRVLRTFCWHWGWPFVSSLHFFSVR